VIHAWHLHLRPPLLEARRPWPPPLTGMCAAARCAPQKGPPERSRSSSGHHRNGRRTSLFPFISPDTHLAPATGLHQSQSSARGSERVSRLHGRPPRARTPAGLRQSGEYQADTGCVTRSLLKPFANHAYDQRILIPSRRSRYRAGGGRRRPPHDHRRGRRPYSRRDRFFILFEEFFRKKSGSGARCSGSGLPAHPRRALSPVSAGCEDDDGGHDRLAGNWKGVSIMLLSSLARASSSMAEVVRLLGPSVSMDSTG